MKRGIITAILILICFLLQCTVFRFLAFGGIVPNLMIVLTASFGFMRGEKTGLMKCTYTFNGKNPEPQ